MASPTCTRRRLLTLAAAAWPLVTRADGPALVRALAEKGTLLDLVAAGTRLVAVGERGHVLLSDDQGRHWRQAQAVPTRTTLTALHATDARTLWAAGHGGMILRSDDAGEHWTVVTGKADGREVLLSLRVQADGRGLAVGGFGYALATADGGATWKPLVLLDGEAGEKHLNRIFVSAAGRWLIAAEGGHILRSGDGADPVGGTWSAVATPYSGSLWCGTQLPAGVLLAGGMRGNLVRSSDDGRTWTHQAVPQAGSFTAVTALADGRPLLVGVDGTVVVGDRSGERFRMQRLDDRATLTAALPLRGGGLAVASAAGVRLLPAPG